MRLRPICGKCGREMFCARNDVVIYHPFEHATPGPIQEGGVVYTDRMIEGSWKDGDIDFACYGDKYQCPDCGTEVVIVERDLLIATPFTVWKQKDLKRIVAEAEEVLVIRRKK